MITDLKQNTRRATQEILDLHQQTVERNLEQLRLMERHQRALVESGLSTLEQQLGAWQSATQTWMDVVLPETKPAES